jgi:hypothetical protein
MTKQIGFASKVTPEQKAVIHEMAAHHKQIRLAFREKPEYKTILQDVPYHSVIYFFNKFKNIKKSNQKTSRNEETGVIVLPKENLVKMDDSLNFCPECGCHLRNIKNTMKLEKNGRI